MSAGGATQVDGDQSCSPSPPRKRGPRACPWLEQGAVRHGVMRLWVPAFAGMTKKETAIKPHTRTIGSFARDTGLAMRNAAAVLACLLLTVCAGQPSTVEWVKPGVDDAAVSHEIDDCQAQANVALGRQQRIDQDISASLGRNWQMSGTAAIQNQSMQEGAAGVADQVFNSCMRAKGFKKQG